MIVRKHPVPVYASIVLVCLVFLGDRQSNALQRQAGAIVGEAAGSGNITIRNSNGQSLQVQLPVKRIVVLNPDALEAVRALKALALVVGVNSGIHRDNPLFWPGLSNRPGVGSWKDPNYEQIVQLEPDIVICYARRPGMDLEKKLGPFGIKAIRLDFQKIGTLEKELRILGRVLNKEKEAGQLIDWYREQQEVIREGLKKIEHRHYVYSESYSPYHTSGPGSGGNEICILAGGFNIASGFSIPYPEVTPEWVLAKNPQVIIKAAVAGNCYGMGNGGPLKAIRKEIMRRPAWNTIRAIRDARVYVIESGIWTGPRAIIGISYLAKWFYPEIFEDLDPEARHREYLERFQGIKYQGVYVSGD